jgi:hypothetical protein
MSDRITNELSSKLVKVMELTIASAVSVPAHGEVTITGFSSFFPAGAVFLAGHYQSGTTSGGGNIIIGTKQYDTTDYICARNISNNAVTLGEGRKILISYFVP